MEETGRGERVAVSGRARECEIQGRKEGRAKRG